LRIAFDIDDTITLSWEFFEVISQALLKSGHDVYIISYRDKEGQKDVEEELAHFGIAFTKVILPSQEELSESGFYEWKAEVCRRLKVDIFFEDMPEVINCLDDSTTVFYGSG